MVDSQVRPNQVNDRRVVEAMRMLPRERFSPNPALAYADLDIALGKGRYMLAPMLTARLAQLVLAGEPEQILVVGAGTGYGAALLAACGADVVALEEDAELVAPALSQVAPRVQLAIGKLAKGWPGAGPFDVILIEGAVTAIPAIFAAQLTPNGRLVTILADGPGPGGIGRAVVAQAGAHGFATATMFDCTARILPAFQPAFAFSF